MSDGKKIKLNDAEIIFISQLLSMLLIWVIYILKIIISFL
jgi:hypothetical protein